MSTLIMMILIIIILIITIIIIINLINPIKGPLWKSVLCMSNSKLPINTKNIENL